MPEVIEQTEYKKGYKKTKLGWVPEDWKILQLKDICPLQRGFDLPLSEVVLGKYPIVYSNGIQAYNKEFKVKAPGVITGRSGTIGKVHFIEKDFWPHNTTLWVTDFKNNNPKYIYYLLISLNLGLYHAGSGVPTLNRNDIHIKYHQIPPIKEQEKIAEILSAWDDGIETLEKLIEQKEIFHKALMKNLLIGKIRLFGFSKNSEYKRTKLGLIPVDWQVKPLKLLFDKRMQKYSGNTEYNIFTNSATKGIVLQNEYFDRSIVTEENTSNYYVVREDDFMYNPRISQSAPAGPINRNKLGITGIASPLYTIFKAKHDTIVDFYEQYFSSNLWNNSMFIVANQGARHDRLNITSNDFMNMPLPYPPIKEQEKIANILIESYKEIQILNSKLEKLKDQKKGLMQKLLTGQIRVKV